MVVRGKVLANLLPFLVAVCGVLAAVASAEDFPDRAVVDSHPVQPQEAQFGGADSVTPRDMSSEDAKEVGQLYRQLMSGGAPPTSADGSSDRISSDLMPSVGR